MANLNEERNMNALFQDLLSWLMNQHGVEEEHVEEAIENMTRNFTFQRGRLNFPNMTEWNNICGYVFRFALHGASLTRHRVLEALRDNEALVLILRSKVLNIISLGGGPGNDIVGLCSALFEYGVRDQRLNITVVDEYKNWLACVRRINEMATNFETNFGNLLATNNVHMSFLRKTLPDYSEENRNYLTCLQSADIILMVKLISVMDMDAVGTLTRSLLQNMKDEAIILLIDSPKPLQYSYVTERFDVLFRSDGLDYTNPTFNTRFNSSDSVTTNAQISVLRKRRI